MLGDWVLPEREGMEAVVNRLGNYLRSRRNPPLDRQRFHAGANATAKPSTSITRRWLRSTEHVTFRMNTDVSIAIIVAGLEHRLGKLVFGTV